jgi:hypothetical protein
MSEASDSATGAGRGRGIAWAVTLSATIVAGVYCAVVGIMLVRDWSRSVTNDPFDSEELARLREAAIERPGDEALVARTRAMDLEMRRLYFYRHRFARRGGMLLLAGVVVLLIV